jgi:acetyl-CoA/propionyl-CoA carboxylase biotin carboxyl carrier protein
VRKTILLDGARHELVVRTSGATFHVDADGTTIEGTRRWDGTRLVLELAGDGRRIEAQVTRGAGGRIELWLDSERHVLEDVRRGGAGTGAGGSGDDTLVAPMPAKVVRIAVAAGDDVEEGQTLVVLESMKMELGLTAPRAGRVARVSAVVGVIVPAGTTLVELEPAGAGAEQDA